MPNLFRVGTGDFTDSSAKTRILRGGMQPPQSQPPSSPPVPSEAEIQDAVGWLQDPSRQQAEGAPSAVAQAIAQQRIAAGRGLPASFVQLLQKAGFSQ